VSRNPVGIGAIVAANSSAVTCCHPYEQALILAFFERFACRAEAPAEILCDLAHGAEKGFPPAFCDVEGENINCDCSGIAA
jgi:hypothetical protein